MVTVPVLLLLGSACGGATAEPETASGPRTYDFDNHSVTQSSADLAPRDTTGETREPHWLEYRVETHLGAYAACYRQVLDATPGTVSTGVVTIRFVIAADGTVSEASVAQSSFAPALSAAGETCLLDATRALTFSAGTEVDVVNYPFDFQWEDPTAPAAAAAPAP